GQRIAAPVALGHLVRRSAEERRVVALERLHLVLERRDVVTDRHDADPGRPAFRLNPEAEQREVAAPRPARENRPSRIDYAAADDQVVRLREILELDETGPSDDRVAPRLAVAARAPIVDEHDGEA